MATTLTAMPISHPWARRENSDPYGMAEIIASLGRINISRHVQSTPDWSIIDTPDAVSHLVDTICLDVGSDAPSQVPALYIDIQTVDDSTQGPSVTLLQIYLLPREHIYLVDVQTLGRQGTFETEGPAQGETLKTILESATIPKVFFDVRTDAEILYHRYGVSLGGVQDLQLMELAARVVCPSGSTSLPSSHMGSDLMKSGMGMSRRSMSAIRRSSRSRSGSVTPPVQYRYPISPPATPTSNTVSLSSSPASTTSHMSHAGEASSATTASTSTNSNTQDATNLLKHPSQHQDKAGNIPRQQRRSLRHLNSLPRCINRDLNLSILEQITWDKWIALQKKRSQVEMANRELRRLNGLLLASRHQVDEGQLQDEEMEVEGEGYQLLKMDKGMDISARPLSKGSEMMELIGLVVLNVRYLPGLWGEYERRLRTDASHWQGGNETCVSREEVWRIRVEQETKKRVELDKSGQYALVSGAAAAGGKGRGKLMMLAPVGWDCVP